LPALLSDNAAPCTLVPAAFSNASDARFLVKARSATAERRKPRADDHAQIDAKGRTNRWSQRVTRKSGAFDLDRSVFKLTSATKIAQSMKGSTKQSSRRKTGACRSAPSRLTSYSQPRRQETSSYTWHTA
jgi:hypothetical protein